LAGRIPDSFIDTLLERVDIVEVVGARLSLKATGRGEHKALCPFHNEKSPSFTVSGDKQFYHCFGCGAHGSAIGFLIEHDGLDFVTAIEELAQMVGLEVPREGGSAAPQRSHEPLYQALSAAQTWFQANLHNHPPAMQYLQSRGFDQATLDEFGVGYAPDQWQALSDHLQASGHSDKVLEEAGLVSRSGQRISDRFRDRIIFPIHDRRGRVIAFGGRALTDRGPKYLNSPETPVFHKGRELYRLFQARRKGLPERILVVEGYMDAAALFQYGFENAVATLGTAVTADHLQWLFKSTPVVVFCFDGDRAGRQAAWRGLEAALPIMSDNRELRFLFLPEGEDPDSLVRAHGAAALQQQIDTAQPLSSFFFDQLSAQVDMTTLDGRARLIALAKPHLAKLPAGPFAELMNEALQQRAGHAGAVAASSQADRAPRRAPNDGPDLRQRSLTLVQYAVALVVQYPAIAADVDLQIIDIEGELKGLDFLRQLIEFCRQRPHLSSGGLLELWREREAGPWLDQLATRELATQPETAGEALAETLARLRQSLIQSRVRRLQEAQRDEGGLDATRANELRELLKLRLDHTDESN